jgi:hypothetical protein
VHFMLRCACPLSGVKQTYMLAWLRPHRSRMTQSGHWHDRNPALQRVHRPASAPLPYHVYRTVLVPAYVEEWEANSPSASSTTPLASRSSARAKRAPNSSPAARRRSTLRRMQSSNHAPSHVSQFSTFRPRMRLNSSALVVTMHRKPVRGTEDRSDADHQVPEMGNRSVQNLASRLSWSTRLTTSAILGAS